MTYWKSLRRIWSHTYSSTLVLNRLDRTVEAKSKVVYHSLKKPAKVVRIEKDFYRISRISREEKGFPSKVYEISRA